MRPRVRTSQASPAATSSVNPPSSGLPEMAEKNAISSRTTMTGSGTMAGAAPPRLCSGLTTDVTGHMRTLTAPGPRRKTR